MPSRRRHPDHQEAVALRLAHLGAELDAVRREAVADLGAPAAGSFEPSPVVESPVVESPVVDSWPSTMPPPTHTRVRVRVSPPLTGAVPQEPAEPDPGPAVVPLPGRHADRRTARRTIRVAGAGTGLLPETLRGRYALGPPQLALVAVLVAVGLAVTTWWVVRADPQPVAAPPGPQPVAGLATPAALAAPAAPSGTAATSPAAAAEQVTVHVSGRVRRPGIVVLDAGARVVDALDAAGGARPGVDLGTLNLARVLVDGEQIAVGVATSAAAAAAGVSPDGGPAAAAPIVDLNTATAEQLETLPEVGPVTAEAILTWRAENGGFTAVEELLEVDGIGEATLETIAPHVTV
ncbi:helix-hairpin-helix domain-containing protein [Nocardioides sp. GCM10027113]|uniref:helix-hairpin-helix domain-containing protein n=1 Tax=unclassified Nocardioides TaxID=2615069 RepID=UPI00360BBC4A